MDNNSKYKETHLKINRLIDSNRLNEAFASIRKELSGRTSLDFESNQVTKLEETYRYLLHYLIEGYRDDANARVIKEIKENLKRLNDIILKDSLLADSSDSYSASRRMDILRQNTLSNLIDSFKAAVSESSENNGLQHDMTGELDALKNIFNYVWTMFGAPKEEYDSLAAALSDEALPVYLKASILSAIILGNLSFYDEKGLTILLDVYESSEQPSLKARAVLGAVMILLSYPDRILNNLQLKSRLLLMRENPDLREHVKEVMLNLIRAYDTKRVTSKMKDDLIPGLMKIRPDIIDKLRNMSSDSDNFLSDSNPEWEELLEQSGVSDKLQELTDMQREGADVMMTTFSNLKSFPFFFQVSNWFLPFISNHPDLTDLSEIITSNDTIHLDLVMCDSDLYSFMLSIKGMPKAQRDHMFSRMDNQLKETIKVLNPEFAEASKFEMARRIRFGIQDLYRFFKLFRKKDEFRDPFEKPLDSTSLDILSEIFSLEDEIIRQVPEFFFKYGYWTAAANLLEWFDKRESEYKKDWEKIGYCYQKLGNFEKAVEWYRKAELLDPDSRWLIKNMAMCLRNSGKYPDAIEYFRRALETEPENFHLLMSAGQAMLEAGDYKGALEQFYHAEYLKPTHPGAVRAIAWTELLNGALEKAREGYLKILSSADPDKADWLNAGHAAMALGDFKSAVDYYIKFIDEADNKAISDLILALRDDAVTLKQLKVATQDLRLVVDKIRYDLKEK